MDDEAYDSCFLPTAGRLPPPAWSVKCAYHAERTVALYAVSALVGSVWMTCQWASGARTVPADPGGWDFLVEEMRLCFERLGPLVVAHHQEWAGAPLRVWYRGDPVVTWQPCRREKRSA